MIIDVHTLPNKTPLFIYGTKAYFSCPQCEGLCKNDDYKNNRLVTCPECGFTIDTCTIQEFLEYQRRMELMTGGL